MSLSLGNYVDLWNRYPISTKKDIFNTNTGLTMDKYGIGPITTKKAMIGIFISEFLSQNRFDLINEIYYDILECQKPLNQYDIYEFLCIMTIGMNGMPFDNYWLYMALDNFYSTYKKDLSRRLEVCRKSFEEIELYLPYLKKGQDEFRKNQSLDEIGSLPNFVFCRDRLLYSLIDAKLFEEAEKYEQLMIEKNYFPDKNGKERLRYNRIFRLNEHIGYLIKENQVSEAIKKIYTLNDIDSVIASYSFKKIANYFLRLKNNEKALEYFIIAFEINPAINGIDSKIKKLSDILSLNSIVDKNIIIKELVRRESSVDNPYQLFDIANRYFSIHEYDKSIDLLKRLITVRGEENSLIQSLAKVYKAKAKEKENEQDYVLALKFYLSAFELIENPKFPSKTLDNQKIIIEIAINKLQMKIR